MSLALEACPQCKRPYDERALVCGLCGHVLRRERSPAEAGALVAAVPAAAAPWPGTPLGAHEEPGARRARLEPWLYLGVGLVTAPILLWTPILQYMGWFLAALVHEMGHAALAWLCGMPAVPAISLAGHAAAVHAEQSVLLALSIAAALAAGLWQRFEGRARGLALAALVGFYALVAFTAGRDVVHLLAGHAAELAFASLCLWKALDGGFTDSRLERALYGTLGWTLLGKNLGLCWGLMHSASARSAYRSSGSFGLTNDYLRVAELVSWRLPTVALGMLVVGLLVVPASFTLWRLSARARSSEARRP